MSFGFQANQSTEADITVDSSTPWVAASEGNLTLLQASLSQLQLQPGAADENGYTLLQAAASYCHVPVMQWLLAQKVDVNAVDDEGDTALHYAASLEAAQFLITVAHIDPKLRNNFGKTALESKREELEEMMQDEDCDDDDDDVLLLKQMVEYLEGFTTISQ